MFETILRDTLTENTFYDKKSHAKLTFLKSGYVVGSYVMKLEPYDQKICRIVVSDFRTRKLQRVFGTSGLSSGRNLRNRFVFLEDGSGKRAKLWVDKVLHLFQVHAKGCEKRKEFALVNYKNWALPRNNVDRALGCVSSR